MTRQRWGFVIAAFVVLAVFAALKGKEQLYSSQTNAHSWLPISAVAQLPEINTAGLPAGLVTLRMQFGSKREGPAGKAPTTWDGELSVSGAKLHRVRLWQEHPQDRVDGANWTVATRQRDPWSAAERKKGHAAMPFVDSALLVELLDCTPGATIAIKTAQGNFQVPLDEMRLGDRPATYLDGLVQVTRTAGSAEILTAPTEDDFPAAARSRDGRLYVAYVAFTHGKDFRTRATLREEPGPLEFLAQPTGGDQVLLLVSEGNGFGTPLEVTPAQQDVYGTAVAVDGTGRVWVFWGAKAQSGWDLFARSWNGREWSKPVAITSDPGADVLPAATTDKSGRVWVTWQSLRGTSSDVLAARQDGDGFAKPLVIADSPANEWMPAIAAAPDGQVAVAWDTYQKGDYDVWARVWKDEQLGPPFPVDTSWEGQMRVSATFDRDNRLWLAYETTPQRWGKDWGALEKTGVGLYQGRSVEVRVWADGKLHKPVAEAASAVGTRTTAPNGTRRGDQLAAPRLTTGADGRIWLAVRSGQYGTRTGVGTSWYEQVTWYEGVNWSRGVLCANTDAGLENRPALVVDPEGGINLIASRDGRTTSSGQGRGKNAAKKAGKKAAAKKAAAVPVNSRWPDPVNYELVMAAVRPQAASGPVKLQLTVLESAGPSEGSPDSVAEAADVARVRAARLESGGKTLLLARGEFHRHTELSVDGGGDGMLTDMWRYAMDAVSFDWVGNGDHDNGSNREYPWWLTQKTTELFHLPARFTPMYTYERSCSYPDGHRNVVFAQRGVRPLPRLAGGLGRPMDDLPPDANRPSSPDTQLLYKYLEQFDGVCASHTSGTDMGTDWRDNNRKVEPIVEIYQGCRQNYEMPGAPRSNTADNSIGGWRPLGFVSLALKKGYRLGFQSSSDHGSTHISFCNCWVDERSREGVLRALKARHVYGSTDNIVADVRCGEHMMGDEFTTKQQPRLAVHLYGSKPFAKVDIVRDGNYVYTMEPKTAEVRFEWSDADVRAGSTSYYYVRGEQEDGELVWASPMWITYQP